MMNLIDTLTSNENSESWNSNGEGWFAIAGTWGGGSAVLQTSPDGGTTWLTLADIDPLTVDGMRRYFIPNGLPLRINLSGATTPSLKVWV